MKRFDLYLLLSVIFVLLLIPVCISGVTPTTKVTQNVTKVNLSEKNITSVNSSAKNISANVSGPVYNMNLNTGQPAGFNILSISLQPEIQASTVGSTVGSAPASGESFMIKAPVGFNSGGTGSTSPLVPNTGGGTTNTGFNTPSGWGTTGSTNTNTGQNTIQIPDPIVLPNLPDLKPSQLIDNVISDPCSDPKSQTCVEYCKTPYGLMDWPNCDGVIEYCEDPDSKLCDDYCELNYQEDTCQVQCVKDLNSHACENYCSVVQKKDSVCNKACIKDPKSGTCDGYCSSSGGKQDTVCKTAGQDSDPCSDPSSEKCSEHCKQNPASTEPACKLHNMPVNPCETSTTSQECIAYCAANPTVIIGCAVKKDPPVKSQATPTPTAKTTLTGLPSFLPGDFWVIYPGIKVSSGSISGSSGTGTVTGALPDLIITKIDGPVLAKSGSSITVPFTVKNQGKGKAGPFLVGFFVSTPIVRLESTVPIAGLNPGASYEDTAILKIPGALAGNYYLGAYTDIKNVVRETDENNNHFVRVAPISIA